MVAPIFVPADDDSYNAGEQMLEAAARRGTVAHCAGEVTTGAGLLAHALALQTAFEAAGIAPGERVLLVLRDTPLFHAAFLGALRGGLVPVPVNPLLPERDLGFIARDCDARALVADVPVVASLSHLRRIEAPGVRTHAPEVARTRASDVAFLLYTSGTTGEPKGVVHRHVDLPVTAARYAQPVLGLCGDDRVLSAAKLFFAYGLGNALTFPLLCGAEVVLCPDRPTPESMFALLRGAQPTVFFGVPTLFAAMLAHPDLPATLGRVRLCASAGEALPAPLWQRWHERFGVEILDGLGSTELLHIFVSNRRGAARPGSSGRPVDGYRVRVVDEQDRDVAPGEIGSLLAHGASAALEYHARPEITQRTMFAPGWVRTGDSYRQDDDGFLWHVGRSDDLIKVSGQYVSPVEVEAALLAHAAVVEAAVVGEQDEHGLTKPRAFVVLASAARPSDELARELQQLVKAQLAPHKYPRRVDFVDELPKTATGKIRRHVLREKS